MPLAISIKEISYSLSAGLLMCYFITTMFIIYNDAQNSNNVFNDETLYTRTKMHSKT